MSDIVVQGPGSVNAQSIGIRITAARAQHLSWELYNSRDQLVTEINTAPADRDAVTRNFSITETVLRRLLAQGRYSLRCIARRNGVPVAYADQTFFVWTTSPITSNSRAELSKITSAPKSHSLEEIGAAKARDMMLEHQQQQAKTGVGTLQGNLKFAGVAPAGVARTDCTQYIYDILKYAYAAKGKPKEWEKIDQTARNTSKKNPIKMKDGTLDRGFRGTALLRALQTQGGWKGVFWAPSPRNPKDETAEHPVAYQQARDKGLYSSDKVRVEKSDPVFNFKPTSPTTQPEMTSLDQLKKVPLGIIAARGGKHMTLIIHGIVHEVHWERPPTDPNVIEATPLEQWEWESGVVVMPAESFRAAFGP